MVPGIDQLHFFYPMLWHIYQTIFAKLGNDLAIFVTKEQ